MPLVTASTARTPGSAPAHVEVNPAQAEELLESGSSIGAEVMGDASLLDYESDTDQSPREPQRGPITDKELKGATPASTDTDVMDMDIQQHLVPNEDNTPPGSKTLDAVYHQCRASRTSGFRETLISVSNDSTFGKKVISQSPPFGSFEDHAGIEKTFHGTRVLKGTVKVNQAVSSSFDPNNLMCISCDNEHEILSSSPMIICLSDQNFVPVLPADKWNCVNIVRIENASITELFEMGKEIFHGKTLPEGSVMLIGSASHLGRRGASLYAGEWTTVVASASSLWRGVHICPLIPLVISECQGNLTREISELAVWLDTVYESDNAGFREVWAGVVAAMENASTGATTLETMDAYKIALPVSLASATLDASITFCSINSCPITFNGLSKDNCAELLSSLLHWFSRFSVPAQASRISS
jgi:hypothetical protein